MATEIPAEQPFEDKRFLCTPKFPYSEDYPKGLWWSHPDAKHLEDDYGSLAEGGSYAWYQCPHCGLKFRVTLPD